MGNKRVALITGAGRGIGRSIALELAKEGFDIGGNDIVLEHSQKEKGLLEVKKKVEELGKEFYPVQGDISSLNDQTNIIKEVVKKFGRIDVLVNNAGIAPGERMDILKTTPDSYDRLMSVNARGPFFLTQKTARQMLKQLKKGSGTKGCIIFISSISAVVSSPSRAEYCVSKSALSQTAKVFADRLSAEGINVYEIRPGIINTDMTAPVKHKYDKLISEGLVPQQRWGLAQDVGKAAAALARGDFAYSTGLVLEVSGGMNIRRL